MVPTRTSSYRQYAQELRAEVETALEERTEYAVDCPRVLQKAVRHSLLAPGKRLRPLLVLMAAEACGCQHNEAMPAAVAVEMVHTYSLIHDDLPAMDDDDMRRGRPSCHAMFGEAVAILAGDALLAGAFEVLAQGVRPGQIAARCCAELANAAGATALVGGQVDDLAAEFSDGDLGRLERIHRRKTGAMIRVSLRLGGIVADADGQHIEALDTYGKNLGLAFQIIDDLLDVRGDASAVGKRTHKDSERGKLTFPAILGVPESKARAEQLAQQACEALDALRPRTGHLEALAQYVVERNR